MARWRSIPNRPTPGASAASRCCIWSVCADALASFERALRLDARHAPTLYHLGCALNEQREHERALALFERLLEGNDSPHAQAWFRHGQTLQALDRHAEALPSYERALALDAAQPQAWLNRADILKHSGRTAEAIAAYRTAITHGAERELVDFYLAPLEGGHAASAPRSYVRGLFDDYAANFDAHLLGALRYHGHEILVDTLKAAAPARRFRRALDLGCGTGLCGPLLKPLAAQVDGVDLSPQMIAQARRRGVYDDLVQAEITEHLNATESRYDLVLAADVFTYVGAIEPVFAALAARAAARWTARFLGRGRARRRGVPAARQPALRPLAPPHRGAGAAAWPHAAALLAAADARRPASAGRRVVRGVVALAVRACSPL